jgi:hypothetical protein
LPSSATCLPRLEAKKQNRKTNRGELMQTEMSIEIERPITQVFDYTTNNVAEWCSVVVKDEVIDKKPEGVGTTFRVITEERGHRMELDGVVTRHEPPTAHTVFMKGKQVDIEAEYFFKDLGGRTRVTQRSTVKGKGFVKLMLFLFGWLMKKSSRNALEKELSNLKRLIEARKSQPA